MEGPDRGHQGGVGQHHSLRHPRGPTGVHDDGGVLRAWVDRRVGGAFAHLDDFFKCDNANSFFETWKYNNL